jgi:hypothetical protein
MKDLSYSNDLREALLNKNGPEFWKCLRSKFETSNSPANVTKLKAASTSTL